MSLKYMGIPDRCHHGNYGVNCPICKEIEEVVEIRIAQLLENRYPMTDVDREENEYEAAIYKFEHYLMSGCIDNDTLSILEEFLAWWEEEKNEAISVKRGPSNTSYLDRATPPNADLRNWLEKERGVPKKYLEAQTRSMSEWLEGDEEELF